MALTPGDVKRAVDASGSDIKVFTDGDSRLIQAMALVDGNGDQVGIKTNPVNVETPFAVRYEYDANGNLLYFGKADPGTEENSSLWQIRKHLYTNDALTSILWAGGSQAFNTAWNARASAQYS